MVIFYMFASFIGAFVSFATVVSPYGAIVALLSMPFGASLFVLMAAILIYVWDMGRDSMRHVQAVRVRQPRNLPTTGLHRPQ